MSGPFVRPSSLPLLLWRLMARTSIVALAASFLSLGPGDRMLQSFWRFVVSRQGCHRRAMQEVLATGVAEVLMHLPHPPL